MYTRTYSNESSGIVIPERYGGTSLGGTAPECMNAQDKGDDALTTEQNQWEDVHTSASVKDDEAIETSSFISKLPFTRIFSNIFKNSTYSLQKIGVEEILIIATAAFLFFTKDGDKECAIMLIFLLFLT